VPRNRGTEPAGEADAIRSGGMSGAGSSATDPIVAAAIGILETDGYDAVTLREVARRARVSLGTIYKRFPTQRERDLRTRDALISAAIETWIAAHIEIDVEPPSPDESVYDGLMRMLRALFEPWARRPRMLEAYHRVTGSPHGAALHASTCSLVAPVGLRVLDGLDPTYVDDVHTILGDACDAAIARFAEGHIEATDILPRLERTVYRLTADNAATTAPRPEARPPRAAV